MKSRFTALIILESTNCLGCDVINKHLHKMKTVLGDEDTINEFHNLGYCHFDAFLLAWGVSSG